VVKARRAAAPHDADMTQRTYHLRAGQHRTRSSPKREPRAGRFVLDSGATVHPLPRRRAERLGKAELIFDQLVNQWLTVGNGPERVDENWAAFDRNERATFRTGVANRHAAALPLKRPKVVEVPSATVRIGPEKRLHPSQTTAPSRWING